MSEPVKHFRSDYKAPAFEVESLFLDFRLGEEGTDVLSEIKLKRTAEGGLSDLVLDGEELELLNLSINNSELESSAYQVTDSTLTLPASLLPSSHEETFQLNMSVRVHPETNTGLMGLYKSSGNFCTQCEAEGFRRITYFFDRPDVLTKYLVRVEAEKARYPVLLSNGNLLEEGDAGSDRHFAVWEDPFNKPSYLFALVAGDLGHIHDTFQTMSGKEVQIGFYSEHANVGQLHHAMESLKKSMKYDEEAFGRECDLDMYNVVAVGDFNMGAMENKGLNVFNTACVLADPKTSTDQDFAVVEAVIFHEYAHNWSGNRVTLRDWFQLTLKEGFTVYRDSRFSAAMTDEVVKRIEDVKVLRARQFVEDSGPTAHPIRPEHYVAMDNFYTLTVYEKGCEVVRMYERLFGRDGFRKGTDLYFDRFDGMAVTCDDFRLTMAEANNADLEQFERWYLQAGTPTVRVEEEYKESEQTYVLRLTQQLPSTPGQPGEDKLPHHIPIEICYYDETGAVLVPVQMLELKEMEQEFVFENVAKKGFLSINRDFTAPIIVDFPREMEELSTLLRVDDDGFSKWEYAQQLATESFMRVLENPESVEEAARLFTEPVGHLLQATRDFVVDGQGEPVNLNVIAYCIEMPDETMLGEHVVWKRGHGSLNPREVHDARVILQRHVAQTFQPLLSDIYHCLHGQEPEEYQYNSECVGRRSLKNACLTYLACLEGEETEALLFEQFSNAVGMTDKLKALSLLMGKSPERREAALAQFLEEAGSDELVVDKWFSVQALSTSMANFEEAFKALLEHPAMKFNNPNRVRALLASFAIMNSYQFHSESGWGYEVLGDCVEKLDAINPSMAARIVQAFSQWHKFVPELAEKQKDVLKKLQGVSLSKNTKEMVDTCLGSAEEESESKEESA